MFIELLPVVAASIGSVLIGLMYHQMKEAQREREARETREALERHAILREHHLVREASARRLDGKPHRQRTGPGERTKLWRAVVGALPKCGCGSIATVSCTDKLFCDSCVVQGPADVYRQHPGDDLPWADAYRDLQERVPDAQALAVKAYLGHRAERPSGVGSEE